ncbi:acyl carrier protein [Vallitalea sp.]|jgi:acyl carrier protein|uniref:acyl carrier protein n=1 Tax=Vallitalea sp. TaxID=1882829 RepID=UPI0025DFED04|nr:acyl carrier protein [Vallitalea sp.]MCT4686730.1 acyl carrier protein [Vallitalea sp.]
MDQSVVEKQIKEEIIKVTKRKIETKEINSNTDLWKDLEMDSIQIVQLMLELEKRFNIIFEDEDLEDDVIINYGKLSHIIINKVAMN